MQPDELLSELGETYRNKNDDYADTWVISGIALSMLHGEPVRLDSAKDHVIAGNTHRLLDKVLRGFNAAVAQEEMNFEGAHDSFADASVYAAMIASVVDDRTLMDNAYVQSMPDMDCYRCGDDASIVQHMNSNERQWYCSSECMDATGDD